MMVKKSEADLGDLLIQMKISNRLLAAQLRGSMQQNELVGLLASTGASNQEIGDVLDTSAAVVATTLGRLRKKEK
jgi:DNA-binding CsgD family transcriptional regulator